MKLIFEFLQLTILNANQHTLKKLARKFLAIFTERKKSER